MFSRLRVYLLELTFSWQGSSFRYWNYPDLIIFHMFSLWFSISVYRLGPVCSDSVNSLIGTLSFGSPELTWFLRLVISRYQVFMILWSISANALRVFISFCLYRDSFLVTSATLRSFRIRSSARTSSSSATFCIAFVFDSDFRCFVTTFGFYIFLVSVVFNFIIFRCWRTFRILLLMMIIPTNLLLLMLMWLIMLVLMVILMMNIFRVMMFFVMRMRLYRFPSSPDQLFFVIVAFGFLLVVSLRFGSYAVSLAVNVFNGFLSNSIPCV